MLHRKGKGKRNTMMKIDLKLNVNKRGIRVKSGKQSSVLALHFMACGKMASAYLKGTRKMYSFEERKILISLIKKYEIVEDRRPNPISICKRKSAWLQITEEYNSIVGPQNERSCLQLRRCWENMKACKRYREEKKSRDSIKAVCQSMKDEGRTKNQCWESAVTCQNTAEMPTSTGTIGLPPNIVFEPDDSEPFTLQSVCTARSQNLKCSKKNMDNCQNTSGKSISFCKFIQQKNSKCTVGSTFRQMISNKNKCDSIAPTYSPMGDCYNFVKRNMNSPVVDQSVDDRFEKNRANSTTSCTLISPSRQEHNSKTKTAQREEELHVLALSEAQMKVDIAAMLKEETKIKLQEAHYRKEEARLRMLFFTYKLDKSKED